MEIIDNDYEHRLTKVEERSKLNAARLDNVEKRQNDLDELVGTVKALAVREENVENDVKEIKTDVKTLTGKAGQKWDSLITTIITALAGGVIGFMLSAFGM